MSPSLPDPLGLFDPTGIVERRGRRDPGLHEQLRDLVKAAERLGELQRLHREEWRELSRLRHEIARNRFGFGLGWLIERSSGKTEDLAAMSATIEEIKGSIDERIERIEASVVPHVAPDPSEP